MTMTSRLVRAMLACVTTCILVVWPGVAPLAASRVSAPQAVLPPADAGQRTALMTDHGGSVIVYAPPIIAWTDQQVMMTYATIPTVTVRAFTSGSKAAHLASATQGHRHGKHRVTDWGTRRATSAFADSFQSNGSGGFSGGSGSGGGRFTGDGAFGRGLRFGGSGRRH